SRDLVWSSEETVPDYTPLAPSRSARFGLTPRALQAPEERDEVGLLLFAEPERKAPVVEIHDVAQRGGRTVVEVRRPTGEPTQDRSFEASDVLPATGDHRPPRVGDDLDLARRPVAERVDRHRECVEEILTADDRGARSVAAVRTEA